MLYPTSAVIAATAPSVTSAVENQRTATNSHTGRGLGLVYTGTLLQEFERRLGPAQCRGRTLDVGDVA